jgi:hypothetical protein
MAAYFIPVSGQGARFLCGAGGGKSMRRDIGVFLFALGLAFFNWPLMGIFKDSLILYLSTVWFVFIALLVIATIISEKEEDGR